MSEKDTNRRYSVNMGNPAPGYLERAERAMDDMEADGWEPACPHTGSPIDTCICMDHDSDGSHYRARTKAD